MVKLGGEWGQRYAGQGMPQKPYRIAKIQGRMSDPTKKELHHYQHLVFVPVTIPSALPVLVPAQDHQSTSEVTGASPAVTDSGGCIAASYSVWLAPLERVGHSFRGETLQSAPFIKVSFDATHTVPLSVVGGSLIEFTPDTHTLFGFAERAINQDIGPLLCVPLQELGLLSEQSTQLSKFLICLIELPEPVISEGSVFIHAQR